MSARAERSLGLTYARQLPERRRGVLGLRGSPLSLVHAWLADRPSRAGPGTRPVMIGGLFTLRVPEVRTESATAAGAARPGSA